MSPFSFKLGLDEWFSFTALCAYIGISIHLIPAHYFRVQYSTMLYINKVCSIMYGIYMYLEVFFIYSFKVRGLEIFIKEALKRSERMDE